MDPLEIDGDSLTLEEVEDVSLRKREVRLSAKAIDGILSSQKLMEDLANGEQPVYGVTTGFGSLHNVSISKEDRLTLQRNLIRSHSCGLGEPFPEEDVRAIILLRANALAKGYSGIRLDTVKTLLAFLSKDICPVVPQQGSVGASGDLAPLAHVALALIGEGKVFFEGELMNSQEALRKASIKPIVLQPKEGLALINGTQVMTGVGLLTLLRAERLCKTADIAGAMTFEALKGNKTAYDRRIHEIRPHLGQKESAENLLRLLKQKNNLLSDKARNVRVQDPYCLRCIPQVHGAVRDVIRFVRSVLEIEINSATDNPLVFSSEKEVLSGGNFHGEPVAFAMDFLGISTSEISNISERRIARLLDPLLSGLPAGLSENPGLNSGLTMLQIVAASLVSENKVLCSPASVDSIPTAANQEDHVSMGVTAARKARIILQNAEKVIAMELICGAQGIDFLGPIDLGLGTRKAYELIRSLIPKVKEDRSLQDDVNRMLQLIVQDEFLKFVQDAAGKLN